MEKVGISVRFPDTLVCELYWRFRRHATSVGGTHGHTTERRHSLSDDSNVGASLRKGNTVRNGSNAAHPVRHASIIASHCKTGPQSIGGRGREWNGETP